MPQVVVNSANIGTFSFSAAFDIANRQIILTDTSIYNNISGHGILFVDGIAFSIIDQDGVPLATIDWANPQLPTPATQSVYNLDLSSLNFAFLFQTYSIIGAIKDSTGTIYSTTVVYKKVSQPIGFNENGYVNGIFKITPNIPNNTLAVSEATPFIYNNNRPTSIVKNGNLYYPTGTISPVSFTGTPFSNNTVFSGQYRIVCTSVATYDLGDMVSVMVSYYTDNPFNVFVGSKMSDLNCCIVSLQETAKKRCSDAVGQAAKQKLLDISTYLMGGISAEINGQDASFQYEYIKKYLNCDCGSTSLQQNEMNPINPTTTSIIVVGSNGTTSTPSANGNTTTYTVSSNVYQVVKGNTGDLAFTLSVDNSVSGITKTVITFNYTMMAGYLLTAIGGSDTLTAQLNALILSSNFTIDLSNLDGKCILDIGLVDYFLTYKVPSGSAVFKDITINGTKNTAPSSLIVSGTDAITAYLNSLSLGTFASIFDNSPTGTYFSIISAPNVNILNSITLTIDSVDVVVNFQATSKSIVAVLQAIIDYLCGLTALQIALGSNISLLSLDYNGSIVVNGLSVSNSQNDFNLAVANSIASVINRITSLSAITCTKLQSLFQDYPLAIFNVNSDRILSVVAGNCTTLTARQQALSFIAAVNAYSDVKAAFCGINCTLPGTCPDVENINLSIVGGSSIRLAIYGIDWTTPPLASQVVTVNVRRTGTTTWITSTNALSISPNGNISGTSPYLITGIADIVPNTSYDVQVINNCGGVGFIKQITTPASGIFANSYSYGNILYLVCGISPVTLYSSSTFGIGTTMYTDSGLTIPLTGNVYIVSSSGEIFNINSTTGTVLSDTGSNCNNGTVNSVKIGNNSTIICENSFINLYTNGTFDTGGTLFRDSSLSSPVTGNVYVLFNNTIYNLNSTTGLIGSSTGLTCTAVINLDISANPPGTNFNINNVTVNGVTATPPVGVSYPIPGGQTLALTTNQIGTVPVGVNFNIVVAAGHSINVKITDSSGASVNADFSTTGIYTITSPTAIVNNIVPVTVLLTYT